MTPRKHPAAPSIPSVEQSLGPCPDGHGKAYKVAKRLCAGPPCGWCWVAKKRAQAQAVARRQRGTTQKYTPAGDTRKSLRSLTDRHGWSRMAIARAVSVHPSTIRDVQRGLRTTIKQDTADAIHLLVLKQSERSRRWSNRVPIDRARRAVQGMMWHGYAQYWISEQIGYSPNAVAQVNTLNTWVTLELEKKIIELARTIGPLDRGASTKTRSLALKRGYKPLVAWDDIV